MSETPTTMRASVLTEPRVLQVQERPVPTPAADEVLVEVGSVGVCGSDVHYWAEGRLGDFVVTGPIVLGHEVGGTIVAVGSDVDPFRVGERVGIEPQRPGTSSRETLSGHYNLDPEMEFYATPPVDGAFQQYVTIQSHFAHTVTADVSDDAIALLEPLSVAIHAARKAEVTIGSRILITGSGPIGVALAQVARAYGAAEIIVTDLDEKRRETALRFGATRVIDPAAEDVGGLGLEVDAFIDASGAAAAVRTGIREVRPAGRVVLVGNGPTDVELPVQPIRDRELVLTGVFRYTDTWPTAIELVSSGKVDLDAMVTGRFGLDEVEQAMEATRDPASLKAIVRPGD